MDYETLSKLRKGLPNPRRFINSAGGETINFHTIGISRQPPSQTPVTQPEDRLGGGGAAPDPTGTRHSDSSYAGQSAQTFDRPPCCTGTEAPILHPVLPATLHLRNNAHTYIMNVLIDNGCLQANIISVNIATLLAKDGGHIFGTNIVLTAGVGGQSYGFQGIMISKDVTIDLIIRPSILYYNLLPPLETHARTRSCCEICQENTNAGIILPGGTYLSRH